MRSRLAVVSVVIVSSLPLNPGDMMIMQPQTHHFAWNKEEVIVQLNGMGPWGVTYIDPADDPRKK